MDESDNNRHYVEFDCDASNLAAVSLIMARVVCEVKIKSHGPAGGNPQVRVFPIDPNDTINICRAIRRAHDESELMEPDDLWHVNVPKA